MPSPLPGKMLTPPKSATARSSWPSPLKSAAATEKAYADLFAAYPDYTATVAKVVAEGDLVAVHTHVQDHPGDLGTSVYEIFLVQHGKIVEHWSDTQDVPATSVNGNSMF